MDEEEKKVISDQSRRWLCAGYSGRSEDIKTLTFGNDSCRGDSGGPLVLKENKRFWSKAMRLITFR